MTETTVKKSFTPVMALREFFGLLPGQTLAQFVIEIKQLSMDERDILAKLACEEMGWDLKAVEK